MEELFRGYSYNNPSTVTCTRTEESWCGPEMVAATCTGIFCVAVFYAALGVALYIFLKQAQDRRELEINCLKMELR